MTQDRKEEHLRGRLAAQWCVTMAAGSARRSEKARFAEWVTGSPENLREFAAMEALWKEAGRYGSELRRGEAVVSLFPEGGAGRGAAPARRRPLARGLKRAVAAAAAVLLCGLALGLAMLEGKVERYATEVGENRLVTLSDGSLLQLNTATELAVRFSQNERRIALERGEAYFDVAKDPVRPFVVRAGTMEVRAIGTGFNVKAVGPAMAVTVVEGVVLVSPAEKEAAGAPEWRRSLTANRQLRLAPGVGAVEEQQVSAELVTSWRHNTLRFEDEPLASVVADFNRYNRRRLEVVGEGLADLAVSGTFDPRDPEAFADAMAAAAGLRVITRDGERIVLKRRQSSGG